MLPHAPCTFRPDRENTDLLTGRTPISSHEAEKVPLTLPYLNRQITHQTPEPNHVSQPLPRTRQQQKCENAREARSKKCRNLAASLPVWTPAPPWLVRAGRALSVLCCDRLSAFTVANAVDTHRCHRFRAFRRRITLWPRRGPDCDPRCFLSLA